MKSAKVIGFMSCSFADLDREHNEYFNAICKALDIQCQNVSDGYKESPPEKARQLIEECQLFIAIATKREKLGPNEYNMPPAVHDEISMAYAMRKPMLLFKENEVNFKGFLTNYGTHVSFQRDDLKTTEFLRKAISSIHTLKLDVLSSHDLSPEQDTGGFYAENFHVLYELVKDGADYTWVYTMTRRLVFLETLKSVIRQGAWTTITPETVKPDDRIEWKVALESSSKNFKIETSADRDTAQCIEVSTKFTPAPEKGDFIELSHYYKSKHLNRIYKPVDGEIKPYMIGDRAFHCFDGVVPIMRTKDLTFQFRFPREYGLRKEDVFPFVGSYSSGIDYLVESELKRSEVKIQNFGGNLIIDFKVESPLLRHVYGIAWKIPGA